MFPSPCGEKVGINAEAFPEDYKPAARAFPSPCGEKVGINLVESGTVVAVCYYAFPSPCGEKVGINRVPGRSPGSALSVSVPLRGKGRDQPDWQSLLQLRFQIKFPSPCGEKVGINLYDHPD